MNLRAAVIRYLDLHTIMMNQIGSLGGSGKFIKDIRLSGRSLTVVFCYQRLMMIIRKVRTGNVCAFTLDFISNRQVLAGMCITDLGDLAFKSFKAGFRNE
jgi:hypothetical protein